MYAADRPHKRDRLATKVVGSFSVRSTLLSQKLSAIAPWLSTKTATTRKDYKLSTPSPVSCSLPEPFATYYVLEIFGPSLESQLADTHERTCRSTTSFRDINRTSGTFIEMSSQPFDIAAALEQVSSTTSSTYFPSSILKADTRLENLIEQTMRLSNELEALGLDTTGLDLDYTNDDSEFTSEAVHATERTLEWVCSSLHIPVYGNKMCPPRHIARKNQYKKDKQDKVQCKNDETAANRLNKHRLRKTKSATKSLHRTSRKEKQVLYQIHASVLQDFAALKSKLDNGCQRLDSKQKAKALRLARAEKRKICFPAPDEAFPEDPVVFVPDEQNQRLRRNFGILSSTFNGSLSRAALITEGIATKGPTCAETCTESPTRT